MSFRSAPIVEQPIHKPACEEPEYLDQKARDYLDRVHWLPRYIDCRESATRLGNPFNKRISKAGKVKICLQLENQLITNQYANQRFQSASRLEREINHTLSPLFFWLCNGLRCQVHMLHRKISKIKQCLGFRPTRAHGGRRSLLKQNVMGDL